MVQAAGFEPAKHYAEDLEPSPFDHSGTPALTASRVSLLSSAASEPLRNRADGMFDVAPSADVQRVVRMTQGSSTPRLSPNQLQTVEKSLFEVSRKQKSQTLPVDLTIPDFWNSVGQLTSHLEAELAETIRAEGMTAKAQLQTRRLGNVRTAATDLTRIRLNAFTQHAVLINLMKGGGAEAAAAVQHLSPIQWDRHDGSERAYYESLGHIVEKYKHDVAWMTLVNGSNGNGGGHGSGHEQPVASPETNPSLSEFGAPAETAAAAAPAGAVESAPATPPTMLVPDARDAWDDPDFDEEDRIREMDGYPEGPTGAEPSPPVQVTVTQAVGIDLVRIRILKDLSDPIIAEDGSQIRLAEGDVESCPSLIAETLIAAGLAVAAPL